MRFPTPLKYPSQNLAGLKSRAQVIPWMKVAIWAAVILGVVLRLRHFLANRSLWLDEALLANALIGQPFEALLAPLANRQAAPLGFLAAVWSSVALLGSGEQALRLVSLVVSLGALLLMVPVTRRYLRPAAQPLAVLAFAVAEPQLYYAAELKPYASDVLVALVGWQLGAALLGQPSPRRLILAAAGGALLVWFAFPATLVLAGIAVALVGEAALRRQWADAGRRSAVALAWGVSATLAYLLSARAAAGNDYLTTYWDRYFAPFPPNSFSDLRWYLANLPEVFGPNVAGFSLAGMGVLLALIGCAALWRTRPAHLALLLAPLAVTLAASALEHYPFTGRLILFLAPCAIMLAAEGLAHLHSLMRPTAVWLAPAVGLLLLTGMLAEARSVVVAPNREELRPVLAQIRAEARPDDTIYIYYGAAEATRYYAPRLGLRPEALTYGSPVRGDLPALAAELRGLPEGRAWFVFSHVYTDGGIDEEQFSRYILDQIGHQLERVRYPNATAYLYELTNPTR